MAEKLIHGGEPRPDDINLSPTPAASPVPSTGMSCTPDQASIVTVEAFVEAQMEAAEIGMREISKVNIAVDELYTNVVSYSGASVAEVQCTITDTRIIVTMRDNGTPYDPLQAAAPDTTLSAEDRKIGGLGIFMTIKLMTEVSYRYADGFNEVTICLDR